MPSAVHADVLDSALAVLSSASDTIVALNSSPTTFANATGSAQLASASLSAPDFTLADTTGGRRLEIAAKNAVVSASGTASHVALLDTANQRLMFVGAVPGAALTAGEVCQFLSWSIALAAE